MNQTTEQLDLPAAVQAELLSSHRRCLLLATLADEGAMTVEDLAIEVGAAECATDPESITETERVHIRRDLFESHIPKLTATGILEYDSLLGKVKLAEPVIAARARATLSED